MIQLVGGKHMEIRLIELSDAENFVNFYDKLIRETNYLLPTIEESSKTVEQQENSIKNVVTISRCLLL